MGARLPARPRAGPSRPQRPRGGVSRAREPVSADGAGEGLSAGPRLDGLRLGRQTRERRHSRGFAYGVRTIFVASRASKILYASSAWSSFMRWLMILSAGEAGLPRGAPSVGCDAGRRLVRHAW